MLSSSILVSLRGIATKGTPLKQGPDVSSPENENRRPFFRLRGVLLVTILLVSAGTLALGSYLFSNASQTGSAFQVLEGGVIIGKSSQVNAEGLPGYFIRYRRLDQSQATWQVPAKVYRERKSGHTCPSKGRIPLVRYTVNLNAFRLVLMLFILTGQEHLVETRWFVFLQ